MGHMSFWKCPKCEHENRIIPPHFEGQWFGSLTEIKGVAKIEGGECKTLFDSISISATDIQKYQAKRERAERNMKLANKKAKALEKIMKQMKEDNKLQDQINAGPLAGLADITSSADFSELRGLGDFEEDPEVD